MSKPSLYFLIAGLSFVHWVVTIKGTRTYHGQRLISYLKIPEQITGKENGCSMDKTKLSRQYRHWIRLHPNRYNPNKKGLDGTDVPGDQFNTGLFKPGETYHIQVFRHDNQIEMHIQNNENASEQLICKWDVSMFPPCDSGRIGLRHMYTRNARYKNIKVWEIKNGAAGKQFPKTQRIHESVQLDRIR